MSADQREIYRKLRILLHAEKIGDASKTCRYFGVAWASFYRWRQAYLRHGGVRLRQQKIGPTQPPNKTPPEAVDKILYLRRKCRLGPERIMWFLERYHRIKVSDVGIYRILGRQGMNRLPRGTRMRKIHTKRYAKQVPDRHI